MNVTFNRLSGSPYFGSCYRIEVKVLESVIPRKEISDEKKKREVAEMVLEEMKSRIPPKEIAGKVSEEDASVIHLACLDKHNNQFFYNGIYKGHLGRFIDDGNLFFYTEYKPIAEIHTIEELNKLVKNNFNNQA